MCMYYFYSELPFLQSFVCLEMNKNALEDTPNTHHNVLGSLGQGFIGILNFLAYL